MLLKIYLSPIIWRCTFQPLYSFYISSVHTGMKADFPAFSMERITDYLHQFEKRFDAKIKDMYDERWFSVVIHPLLIEIVNQDPSHSVFQLPCACAPQVECSTYNLLAGFNGVNNAYQSLLLLLTIGTCGGSDCHKSRAILAQKRNASIYPLLCGPKWGKPRHIK